jgi:hypothetical protein
MAKQKNHVITLKDQSELERLREEYEMLGRQTKLEIGKLIIFALPQRRKAKSKSK